MSPINLLGVDIRSHLVAEFLELRGITTIDLEVIADRAFILADEQGISIMAGAKYQIDTLHFYAEGVEGSCGYAGELPLNIHFGQRRTDVLKTHLVPSKSGGGYINSKGEAIHKWDLFHLDSYAIRLRFSFHEELLELVTIMSLKIVLVQQ